MFMNQTQLQTLKTPSLILDIRRVRQNAAHMLARVESLGAQLRPHVKTHKCVEVARLQTKGHTTGGITVSTLAEAHVFAAHGFTDITYGVPIEPGKFDEAIELSRKCERLSLITDDAEIPRQLNDAARRRSVTLDVYLKVDCGYHRCGVEPHQPEAFEIPRQIADASNLNFAGILTHAGHSYHADSRKELLRIAQHERDVMVEFAENLRAADVPVPIISIGSTPTVTHIDHLDGITEVRAGNYIFFDAFQATLGSCSFENCALTVLASVIHRDRTRRKVVIDAGAVALSKDRGPVEFDSTCGYGRVLDLTGDDLSLRIESLSQEHGAFTVSDEVTFQHLSVGTRVRVLANHSCLTTAQHAHFHVLDGAALVDQWEIRHGW